MRHRKTPEVCAATHKRDPHRPRRAADGLRLCRGCVEGMRRHLAHLPWLYSEVVASMPTQRPTGQVRVSGTRTTGLPVNLAAGELKSQIEYDLYSLSVWVATGRGLHIPSDGRVATVCEWLTPHVDWLAASQYAAETRDVLAELVGAAYRVIDPPRRPLELGPCVEVTEEGRCEGTLRATVLDEDDPRPSKIWCDTCTLELTPEQWYRFGRTYRARRAALEREQRQKITS